MSEETQNNAVPKKGMFGITKDTKASNNAPLIVATKVENDLRFPGGYKFPIATLVNVVSNPALEKKDGSTSPVLQFIFKDKDNRQYTHTEWEIEETDTKAEDKLNWLNVRIKHIYMSVFGTFPEEEGIGEEATSWANFFDLVAKAFNSQIKVIGEGDKAKKVRVYSMSNLYYKLIYYKSRLGFPLSPNFLEKVVENKPCTTLSINPTYDKLEPQKNNAPNIGGGINTMSTGDDLPDFNGKFS